MAQRKVVALKILYRTICKKIFFYLTKTMKTRLKAVGVQKMAVKSEEFSLKCYG
jgi:hypothetical protein